jgi:response regulator RpfG family c-di-GMP phosphodiesterase
MSEASSAGSRILVVEDEQALRRLLRRYLGELGYSVTTAPDAPEALELLDRERFDLVVTDLRLPTASGLDLLATVRARLPGTRTVLMSGKADVPSLVAAVERGVDAVLLKPFELEELRLQVEQSLARLRAERTATRERDLLEARLRQRDAESRLWTLRAARALVTAVEVKDAYTAGHAKRVTSYAMSIASVTGGIDLLRYPLAGDLHDVGKIGIPDSVLNKPGTLTAAEAAKVEEHPVAGARILEPLIDDPLVIGVVRWHHERWDGQGYPDGLAGERVPLAARVLAVADTLDAMTSARAYRDALPWDAAVTEIRRCSGTQFDPAVVAAFEAALPVLRAQHDAHHARAARG